MNGLDVHVDERVRLLAAALLLTDFPGKEQRDHPHKPHPLVEHTRPRLDQLRHHQAVQTIAAVSTGWPFLLIVPHVLRFSWPDFRSLPGVVEPWVEIPALDGEEFRSSFRAFNEAVEQTGVWQDAAPAWDGLAQELKGVLAERDLAGFLMLFWGGTGRPFVAVPNPLTPRSKWIGLSAPDAHYAILPPPLILADASEPVAYRSRALQTRSVACHEFSHSPEFHARKSASGLEPAYEEVMARTPANERFRESYPGATWQFSETLLRALQVAYLRRHEGTEAETRFLKSFSEAEGLESLAVWADKLESYLEGRKTGVYGGWDDYLPTYVEELRTMH